MTVRLEGVSKEFHDGTRALENLDLEAGDGELLVLVGPSGSGKSTVLRLVAGLESPTRGRVLIDGTDVTDAEPQRRDVAMVFQSYALYPHKTVAENIAFPLRVRGVPAARIAEQVERVAGLLDIADLLARKPAQLSGGQRQRVALGRAVVREPKAFLLDEPLSNLDPAMRQHTRSEIARLHRRLGVTMLYVTHDQEEAMTLGNRVAVLRDGRLEQVAAPMDLYREPRTRFVASFIGAPAMNLLECRVTRTDDGVELEGDSGFRVRLGDVAAGALDPAGREVTLGVRPHDLEVVGPEDPAALRGVVELVEPRGSDVVVRLACAEAPARGARASAWVVVMAADAAVRVGQPLAVAAPTERLHFFDPATGLRLPSAGSP
ncbi:MAG: ABC transporter ATP-binding protein [Gemmatimonadales bacterium]